ncbi:MAG: sulfatase [Betaproteobacteria bacterium]|nr:sulfatase [Betaproteobacteria bacterium]
MTSNILFLLSDEHDPRVMGCTGHALAHTPHLDALAARGVRFANAWTPCPICVPARASLATGRWVHQTGYWDNAIAYDGRIPGWGHRLQAAGLRVESIGKLHYRDEADPTGFDRQQQPAHIAGGIGQVWGSVRDPLPESAGPSPLFGSLGAGESSYNRYDRRNADLASQWLHARATRAREGDQPPWMLFVGFVAPHFPLVVPQAYLDRYPPASMPLPKLLPRDGYRHHPWVARQIAHMDHDAALGDDERRRLAIACYFALVTFIDEQIGRVLETLRLTGLDRNTLVIYSSDHGDNLGARGMWSKCALYRESTAIPLLLAGPGVPAGRVCRTHANLVDLYPTVIDVMGLAAQESEADLPGRSLLALATSPDDTARPGFSEYHAIGSASAAYMLVRGRYKYHHYVGYPPELFDLESDPEELRDLALDEAYRDVVAQFDAELRAMLDPEGVDRRAKADQNALVERFGGRERALRTGTPGATPVPG